MQTAQLSSRSAISGGVSALKTRRVSASTSRNTAVRTVAAQRPAAPSQSGQAALLASTFATLAVARPAAAAEVVEVPTAEVDTAVNYAIDAVKAAGSLVKSGLDLAGKGAGYAKDVFDKVAPVVKDAADVASPYVKSTVQTASDLAGPALKAVAPTVQGGVTEVERFLSAQGLNAGALLDTAKTASSRAGEVITTAKPSVDSTVSTLSATDPGLLAEYAVGLAALYYLGPPLIKGLFGRLRGYAGEISAAAALDTITNDNNAVLIDIRNDREKEYAGVPDLPSGGKLIELEYASIEDRKIRNQLRNASEIEKQVTAMQIASLKKVGKRTSVLLLDKNGSTAKTIAKELSRRGFKKVYVIANGFSGWTSSKLQTKMSSSVSSVEVLAPVFGTMRAAGTRFTRSASKALPSGR
ncbi:hypothetical protein WJX72_010595 [[Myrmecia] bisecta]|uniref:Rhodanese domain-containing protein n=1 Tax=[Myrmecia] bisecta TaxID=41462 RepID=A0AAW1QGQ8_9CHLO